MRAIGLHPGYALSRCARLARTPGIFSLDAHDWLAPRVCSLSMRAIGSHPGSDWSRRASSLSSKGISFLMALVCACPSRIDCLITAVATCRGKGQKVDGKGDKADVKCDNAAVKGDPVDVKGDNAAVKGDPVDVKGSTDCFCPRHFSGVCEMFLENIPALPVSDWSAVRINLRFPDPPLGLDTDSAELTVTLRPYQAISALENSILPPILYGLHTCPCPAPTT
eukprot:1185104-Prorocentrum_minimum.AAC.1